MGSDKEKDIVAQKEVAFYSALVKAWIDSKMALDKSLLCLSAVAIGFIIITTEQFYSFPHLFFTLISSTSFLICIITVLFIFNDNTKYIGLEITGPDSPAQKDLAKTMRTKSLLAKITFFIGLLMSFFAFLIKPITI